MRRNNNMGMGMGNRGGGGGGPLMTNHLQDLELELELLKRKRQLVQQQQYEMLYRPDVRQTAYNPPRQMFEDRYDAAPRRDSSHLYDEPPFGARPYAPKRRPVPVWDSAPGDRFSGPPGPSKRPRPGPLPPTRIMDHNPPPPQGPRPQPSLLGPRPLMNFNHIPPKRDPKPRPFQTKFKRNGQPPRQNKPNLSPRKPTTNKPAPNKTTPNKPTSNKSTPNKPSGAPVAPKEKENFILTADVKLRSKVSGRLEMALGIILKELKEAHTSAEEVSVFGTPPLARLMRQGIRERLRTLMLGKVVDSVPTVLAEYRKAFPPTMDADLFKLTEPEEPDQKGELAITLQEEDDPELYFKKNLTKLLDVKLDEMFQKAEKSSTDKNEPATSEIVDNLPEVKKAPTEESLKVNAEETTDLAPEEHPKAQEYDKLASLLLARKLPELLAKRKREIIKLLDVGQMFRITKAAVVMNTCSKNFQFRKTQLNISQSEFTESLKDQKFPRNCPYFVKVHASPAMPKHVLMQKFLKQFSPKTIKRCKKVFNILFIGFDNKDDYDRMLKADQTKIDTATLTIVGNVPKTEQIEIKDQKSDALDQALTPQLDEQINDLLSSIRKDDEEENGSGGTNGEIKTEDKSKEIKESETIENKVIEATNDNDSDDDVQEVIADAEVVAIEDDDAAAETAQPAPAPDTPAKPAAPAEPATPSTIRTRRASRLAQNK